MSEREGKAISPENPNLPILDTSDWDPRVRALYEYWRARCRPGRLPGRADIDPVDVPRLLRWMWMVDVTHDPLRFRGRLMGTEHVAAMDQDPTGKWFDEAFPNFLPSSTYTDYVSVAKGIPSYRKGTPSYHIDKQHVVLERVMLPLAADGITVDIILAITVYLRQANAPTGKAYFS
ncbi:MAG: PAS domain-containing protein [Alphaproteobacteria bacterium]|nr:PAS domain-containing protein [Alphaproteobacteria bacterium]MBU0795851.1 PAS domain-containing protein [Alphaproteobacteria bacterium]MBU0886937.1 PAS domain-containing protein [Alphaproteobacteria bacterium]MBU1813207.1 PAS domain-containing protein [Alphaproteobacteria bacterium]